MNPPVLREVLSTSTHPEACWHFQSALSEKQLLIIICLDPSSYLTWAHLDKDNISAFWRMAIMFSTRYVMLFFSKVYMFFFAYILTSLHWLWFSNSQVLLLSLLCWDVLYYPVKTGKCVSSLTSSLITGEDLSVYNDLLAQFFLV